MRGERGVSTSKGTFEYKVASESRRETGHDLINTQHLIRIKGPQERRQAARVKLPHASYGRLGNDPPCMTVGWEGHKQRHL